MNWFSPKFPQPAHFMPPQPSPHPKPARTKWEAGNSSLRALWGAVVVFVHPWSIAASPPEPAASPAPVPATRPVYELPSTGRNIARSNGGWLNADLAGNRLVLTFFDANKKPVAPDMRHGYVQFRSPNRFRTRLPLYLEDRKLVTPVKLDPPHIFFVVVNLFDDGANPTSENYPFQFP